MRAGRRGGTNLGGRFLLTSGGFHTDSVPVSGSESSELGLDGPLLFSLSDR